LVVNELYDKDTEKIDAKKLHTFLNIETSYFDWFNEEVENKTIISVSSNSTWEVKSGFFMSIQDAKNITMKVKNYRGYKAINFLNTLKTS